MEREHILSTNPNFLLNRLITQYKKQDKLIIAYDIDDTVRPMYCTNCDTVQSLLRRANEILDAFFIVFTSNEDIDGVKEYLDECKLPYDTINENAPFVRFKKGKVFYNVLLDDKAGLGETVKTLDQLMFFVDNKFITKENNTEEFNENK